MSPYSILFKAAVSNTSLARCAYFSVVYSRTLSTILIVSQSSLLSFIRSLPFIKEIYASCAHTPKFFKEFNATAIIQGKMKHFR